MDQLIAATVVIGDRSYRIKLNPKDEEVVRRTVKLINDKTIEFKTQFAGKDMQDYIAMVLIWLATEQQSTQDRRILNRTLLLKNSQRLRDCLTTRFRVSKFCKRMPLMFHDLSLRRTIYQMCLQFLSISFPFVSSPTALH
jgi:cell division protein ZapA